MPHFKDGSEAKVGDRVRFPHQAWDGQKSYPTKREGVITDITPGSESCNALVACVMLQQINGVRIVTPYVTHVTLGECDRGEVPIVA